MHIIIIYTCYARAYITADVDESYNFHIIIQCKHFWKETLVRFLKIKYIYVNKSQRFYSSIYIQLLISIWQYITSVISIGELNLEATSPNKLYKLFAYISDGGSVFHDASFGRHCRLSVNVFNFNKILNQSKTAYASQKYEW